MQERIQGPTQFNSLSNLHIPIPSIFGTFSNLGHIMFLSLPDCTLTHWRMTCICTEFWYSAELLYRHAWKREGLLTCIVYYVRSLMHHWVHRGGGVVVVMPLLAAAGIALYFGRCSGIAAVTTFPFQWLYVRCPYWYIDRLLYNASISFYVL